MRKCSLAVSRIQKAFTPAVLVIALSLYASSPLTAYQNEARKDATSDSQTTFRSRSELVLVPTVVTKGKDPVRGLTKDNFIVEQDGKPRQITVFEAIVPQTKKLTKKKSGEGFTNLDSDGTPRAMTLIAIDALNLSVGYQEASRKDIIRFLSRNVVPNQLIGMVVLSSKGIKVVHDFTSDTELLVKALEKVSGVANVHNQNSSLDYAPGSLSVDRGEPSLPKGFESASSRQPIPTDANGVRDANIAAAEAIRQSVEQYVKMEDQVLLGQEMNQIRRTLELFQQIAQGLSGYPGRKSVIWASSGFRNPMDPVRYRSGELMDLYQRTLKLLSDANVVVYPVDVRGLQIVTPGADATVTREDRFRGVDSTGAAYQSASEKIQTFREFAERTGGTAYFDINNNAKVFQEAAKDSQVYYMLGYYLNPGEEQGWHKLKVRLKNADGRVRTRSGFFVSPATNNPEVSRKQDLLIASRSPFDYTTLQLRGSFSGLAGDGPKRKAEFTLRVLPSSSVVDESTRSVDLDFVAVARKADTEIAGQTAKTVRTKLPEPAIAQIKSEGILYRSFLELEPGDYEVRFLVRDNLTGRMGSVLAPLSVK